MSDAQLAARLGLLPCARNEGDPWCLTHDSMWRTLSREVCDAVLDDLDMAERGIDLVTAILRDLIAELREDCVLDTWDKECITHGIAHDDEDGGRCPMGAAADRAEARLREVDTPPNSAVRYYCCRHCGPNDVNGCSTGHAKPCVTCTAWQTGMQSVGDE